VQWASTKSLFQNALVTRSLQKVTDEHRLTQDKISNVDETNVTVNPKCQS